MLLSLRHAELVSASGGKEIPKQVRDDGCAIRDDGCAVRNNGCTIRDDGFAAVLYGESCFLKHIVVC